MKEFKMFYGDTYFTAAVQLDMFCKENGKQVVSFQVLPPDNIYALIDDDRDIELAKVNEILTQTIGELKKNSLDWHYMEKNPVDFPSPGAKVLVVYKTKCDNYVWEPTLGVFTEKGEWKIQNFDNNYHFVVKWSYIPN